MESSTVMMEDAGVGNGGWRQKRKQERKKEALMEETGGGNGGWRQKRNQERKG